MRDDGSDSDDGVPQIRDITNVSKILARAQEHPVKKAKNLTSLDNSDKVVVI